MVSIFLFDLLITCYIIYHLQICKASLSVSLKKKNLSSSWKPISLTGLIYLKFSLTKLLPILASTGLTLQREDDNIDSFEWTLDAPSQQIPSQGYD